MTRRLISRLRVFLFILCISGFASATTVSGQARIVVEPFPLEAFRLLDGPFKAAMERDVAYLLALELDRLLHNFRKLAGLEPKAPLYGGWESMEIAG